VVDSLLSDYTLQIYAPGLELLVSTLPFMPMAPSCAGIPRGWRAQHHREHVEGDYKKPPPPGMYERLHARSRALMKREAVWIAADLRPIVVAAIVEKACGTSHTGGGRVP